MKNSRKIAVIVLTLLLSACSETKTAQELLVSGNNFVQARDFSSAVIEFKNAIRLEPNNANARLMLAKAYIEQGSYLNAEKELSRALALGIEFSNLAALIARTKTYLDKFDEIYQLVERSNELGDNEYIQVLTYAGISALKQQKKAQGQDYLSQAIAIDPNATFSQIAQAYLYYSTREFSEGLRIINDLLSVDKSITEALLIQGHLYYSLQEFELASDAFAGYLTYHPGANNIRFLEINSLIKAEKFVQANVLTETLLKTFKNSPLALQFKAQLAYQKKNYNAAKDYAEEALQYEDLIVAKMISGLSSYFLNDVEQAYTRLNSIEKYLLNTHPAHKVLSVTKFKLGYYSAAAEGFANLEGLTVEDIDLLQKSTASLISIGEFDNALRVLNKAEELSPNNAELIAQKGLIQLEQKDIEGIESLERAVKLDSSLMEAQLALAIEYLKIEQTDKAITIAQELQQMTEEKYLGYLLQGIICVKDKNESAAITNFEKSLLLKPDNIASLYNLGLLYQSRNETAKALTHLKKVTTLSPEHQGALKSLILLASKTEVTQEIIDFLVAKQNVDNFNLSYALAKIYSINKEHDRAIVILESIGNNIEIKKIEVNSLYWLALGDNYLALQNIEKASTSFANGLKRAPQNYPLNLRYIGTLERLTEFEKAFKQVRQVYVYHEDDVRLEVLLAYFSARNGDLILSQKMLNKVRAKNVSHYLLDSVEGEIALIEKRYPQAINALSRLYQNKPTDLNALSLARALKFNEQSNEAENLLEKHLENNVQSIKVRALLAQLYPAEKKDKKIVQYLALVDILPDNVAFLNNLAWNQYKLGQVEQAIIHIERAFELAPDVMEIQETYGHVLISRNKLEQGIKLLQQAIASGSKSKETALLLSQTADLLQQSKG